MSLLFCMMAWSWLRKLVRGYCSAGSFIAPPNWNRFLMLAGLLMSICCIWYGRWWLWWYFLVSYWCLLYMVWAIDVSVVYWSFSWNEQGHDCSPWSSWIRSWDAVPSIWCVCIMGSIKRLNWAPRLVAQRSW